MNWKSRYVFGVVTEVSNNNWWYCCYSLVVQHEFIIILLVFVLMHASLFLASSLAVLHVKLSVRTPLSGPELVLVEEKQLTIGAWPNIIPATFEVHPIHQMETENKEEEDQNPRLPPPQQHTTTTSGPGFSILTEQEKCTPFAPEVCSFSLQFVVLGYIYIQSLLCIFCVVVSNNVSI